MQPADDSQARALDELAGRLLAALPQTQCTRCGYPDCAAYARALANAEADINQCPPGGMEGVQRLSALTGRPVIPLNPVNGTESPRQTVYIDEDWCIGCTLCIKACPTDAIMGSNKLMHTIMEDYCTGCELCIPVCPVDCIHLESASGERTGWQAWSQAQADQARSRYQFHTIKASREAAEHAESLEKKALAKLADLPLLTKGDSADEFERKRRVIEAALARARAKR